MAGTGAAVPSDAILDLKENAKGLDQMVNSVGSTFFGRGTPEYPDGKELLTIKGMNEAATTGNPAVGAAQAALDYKNEAQAYAEAAATNADWVYSSVAAGEAARVDGDYFWVVSADDSEVLELWLMGATTATDTGKRTLGNLVRGDLSSGSLVDAGLGIWRVLNTNSYTDLPSDWLSIRDGILEVAFYTEDRRLAVQTLSYVDNPNQKWVRRIDNLDPAGTTPWVKVGGNNSVGESELKDSSVSTAKYADDSITNWKIKDSQIGRQKLFDSFLYNDVLDGVALNAGNVPDGTHLVLNNVTDTPPSITGASLLEVSKAGAFVMQRITSLDVPELSFWRIAAYGAGSFTDWTRSTGGASSFSGTNVFFLGDSITQNGDYPARVAARLGCTAINAGIGGTRLAQHNSTFDPFSLYRIAEAINTGNYTALQDGADNLLATEGLNAQPQVDAIKNQNWNEVDYIVMLYGTNDYGGDVPFGTLADTDATTLRGAVNVSVQNILTAYPHIRLAFVGPMFRSRFFSGDGENSDDFTNPAGLKLVDYGDVIADAANNNHHVPALDLYRTSGINRYTADTYLIDGLHPQTTIGYQLIADKVSSFLGSTY